MNQYILVNIDLDNLVLGFLYIFTYSSVPKIFLALNVNKLFGSVYGVDIVFGGLILAINLFNLYFLTLSIIKIAKL